MQAEYRSRSRCNVMTLTRARAMLPGNQIGICSPRATAYGIRRVGKAKRAHHQDVRSAMDGGHGASAPLPTLRTDLQVRKFLYCCHGSTRWRLLAARPRFDACPVQEVKRTWWLRCSKSESGPKRTSLVLSNDCTINDLPSIWVLLIGVVQSARVGQHAVKLAKNL